MNYQETLDFLYAQLPMFHRVGAQAYKPSLDNTIALCEAIDNPQHQFKSIHIAGTNGKGSSSHYIASVLQSSNYKTGLYTSPHLLDFRERIKINGAMIAEKNVVDFVSNNLEIIERIQPSFFELCVAMAFKHFAEEKVDIAVIEVGMGGRLDSTNIITPELSLITNISYDHMQFLGNTLPLIAKEKAGIIKKNIPIVISQFQEECATVFEEIAKEKNADIYFADKNYSIIRSSDSTIDMAYFDVESSHTTIKKLQSSLPGIYQQKNIAGVLQSIEILKNKNYRITDQSIFDGIKNVKQETGLRGRWDCLSKNPMVIADTGHNEDGIKQILEQLKLIKYNKLNWVWGMVNDKDASKVFSILPKDASYYFCKPNIPRGLDAATCKLEASKYGLFGEAYESVRSAYKTALENSKKDDLVLIAGSTFVVAEVL